MQLNMQLSMQLNRSGGGETHAVSVEAAPPDFIPASARAMLPAAAPAPTTTRAAGELAAGEVGTGELHPGWREGGIPLLVRVYLSPARRPVAEADVQRPRSPAREAAAGEAADEARVVAVRFVKTFSR